MVKDVSCWVTRRRHFVLVCVEVIAVMTLVLSFSSVRQIFVHRARLGPAQPCPVDLLQRKFNIQVVPVQQCSPSENKVTEFGSGCFFSAGVRAKSGNLSSIRDVVNSNNPCCSIFNVYHFGLLELLGCAPFGNGTDSRTFKLHGNDSNTYCLSQCTCTDLMNCEIAVVSAISSNHFNEAQDMIASVQHFYPNLNIIIYNLGLEEKEVENLTTSCNVHVEAFPFGMYPEFVKKLTHYAWKPLIIGELSQEYEVIIYGDASMRMMKPAVDITIPLMLKFPFIPGALGGMPIVSYTHDGMLRYFNLSLSRKELKAFGHLQAGLWALWAKSAKSKLIRPWTDCAVHKECIAPEGSVKKGCRWELKQKGNGIYIGCHRFEQSALSLILIREFGIGVWHRLLYLQNETHGAFKVLRRVSHYFNISTCLL